MTERDSVNKEQKLAQPIGDHNWMGVRSCRMMGVWFTLVLAGSLHAMEKRCKTGLDKGWGSSKLSGVNHLVLP